MEPSTPSSFPWCFSWTLPQPTPSIHLQPGLTLLSQSRYSPKHYRGTPKSHVCACHCKALSLVSTDALYLEPCQAASQLASLLLVCEEKNKSLCLGLHARKY